jgi:hypothetical protein
MILIDLCNISAQTTQKAGFFFQSSDIGNILHQISFYLQFFITFFPVFAFVRQCLSRNLIQIDLNHVIND